MNEHESIRAMLALAAAGVLDPAESTRVERHAYACDDCRRELETWGRYAYGLRKLPQPSVPPDLMERTRTRLLEERATAEARRWNGFMIGVSASQSATSSSAVPGSSRSRMRAPML